MKNAIQVIGIVLIILVIIYAFGYHLYRKRRRRNERNILFREANQSHIMSTEIERKMEQEDETENLLLKIQMYIISLWLLFVLIIPITLQWVEPMENWRGSLAALCKNNILPIICLFMALLGMVLLKQLKYRWKGTRNLSVQVDEVESENFEYLTFLTTYIIPLVCINLDEIRYVFVLFVLLVIIGVIFIKSDFYLGNPTLALMNYKLYRIQYTVGGNQCERIIIAKEKIKKGDFVEAIPFDEKTWYVRRSTRR